MGKPEGKRPLGRPKQERSSRSGMWGFRTGSVWLRIGTCGGNL